LVIKNSRTFSELSRPPEAFFQDHVVSQQCLNIATTVARESGERCKLPQWDPGQSNGRENIFGIPAAQKTYLVATVIVIFVCRNMTI